VEGIEEYIGVTIVAAHSEEIRQMIINKNGARSYGIQRQAGIRETRRNKGSGNYIHRDHPAGTEQAEYRNTKNRTGRIRCDESCEGHEGRDDKKTSFKTLKG
jgi:hypothetical protein